MANATEALSALSFPEHEGVLLKDWNIVIRGVESSEALADVVELTREFISKLTAAGHVVRIANLTPGEVDLTPTTEG